MIGVGDGRRETIVGGDAGEGIVLMLQGLYDVVTGLTQEFTDGDVTDVDAEGQCIDKHTCCFGYLQVRATTADGAEPYFPVVGVARNDITRSGEQQLCRRDVSGALRVES